MTKQENYGETRLIRLVTPHGHVDGQVRVNPRISTLRYLNVSAVSQSFIVVTPPIDTSQGWTVDQSPLAIALDSIQFVQELRNYTPAPGDRAAAAMYERCAVRLSVGEFAVEGFIHMPPGGNPIARLNSDSHPFFALSAVSVMGRNVQFAAPFLAVRRPEVIALQAVGVDSHLDEVEEANESEVLTTC